MRGLRFPFVAAGLVVLLALLLLADYQREVETRQRFIERTQESAIQSRLHSYQRLLEVLFENIFDRPQLAATLAQARDADEAWQARLRGRLYRDYYPVYDNLTQNDFRELQFVLADGRSFLRFNRPDLYDDRITAQRPLLNRVLKGEVGRGVLQRDHQRPVIRRLGAHGALVFDAALVEVLRVPQAVEEVGVLRAEGRVEHAAPTVDEVTRRHGRPVGLKTMGLANRWTSPDHQLLRAG